MENQDLWKAVLGQIELSLSKANFVTWFKNTSILENKGGVVTIGVPNGFAKEWLENKYSMHILKALKSLDPSVREMRCSISGERRSSAPPSLDSAGGSPKKQSSELPRR
ncbi:MAG: DnaA N-terminal domain-containing protein [Candidatus Moraniibacteriota bacterium]